MFQDLVYNKCGINLLTLLNIHFTGLKLGGFLALLRQHPDVLKPLLRNTSESKVKITSDELLAMCQVVYTEDLAVDSTNYRREQKANQLWTFFLKATDREYKYGRVQR